MRMGMAEGVGERERARGSSAPALPFFSPWPVLARGTMGVGPSLVFACPNPFIFTLITYSAIIPPTGDNAAQRSEDGPVASLIRLSHSRQALHELNDIHGQSGTLPLRMVIRFYSFPLVVN